MTGAIEPEVLPPRGAPPPPESPGSFALRGLAVRILISSFGLWVATVVVSGIHTEGLLPLVVAAVALGFLNAVVRPVLVLLTLPLTLATLGLFLFVVNALMLRFAGALVPGFHVRGFWAALLGALVLSIVSFLASAFVSDRGGFQTIHVEVRTAGGRRRIGRF